MTLPNNETQVISKKRVTDHGEVYTAKREVNAMLDLVKQETERIDSRFLEPACGKGNFLTEVLERKLRIVETRYGKNQVEYERYSVIAVSSIYGIDILIDNVIECRERLYNIFCEKYNALYKESANKDCERSIKYILEKNIICGDALTLLTIGEKPAPIIFSEWSPVNGNMIKRRDFKFDHLLASAPIDEPNLFSDLGEDAFIPDPVKDYPVVHFLRLLDAESK